MFWLSGRRDVSDGDGTEPYCSALCDPGNDTCPADSGDPLITCKPHTFVPRVGACEANGLDLPLCKR